MLFFIVYSIGLVVSFFGFILYARLFKGDIRDDYKILANPDNYFTGVDNALFRYVMMHLMWPVTWIVLFFYLTARLRNFLFTWNWEGKKKKKAWDEEDKN